MKQEVKVLIEEAQEEFDSKDASVERCTSGLYTSEFLYHLFKERGGTKSRIAAIKSVLENMPEEDVELEYGFTLDRRKAAKNDFEHLNEQWRDEYLGRQGKKWPHEKN